MDCVVCERLRAQRETGNPWVWHWSSRLLMCSALYLTTQVLHMDSMATLIHQSHVRLLIHWSHINHSLTCYPTKSIVWNISHTLNILSGTLCMKGMYVPNDESHVLKSGRVLWAGKQSHVDPRCSMIPSQVRQHARFWPEHVNYMEQYSPLHLLWEEHMGVIAWHT